jgi:inhibitor of cysteine peptidase
MNRWKQVALVLVMLGTGLRLSAAEPVLVTEEQNGGTVTLAQGQHMILTLPGNPSTGYEWKVPQEIQATLTLHDSSFAPGSDRNRIGAPGHYTFDFEAQQAGTVNLEMAYARGWETEEPANTFTLTIEIVPRPAGDTGGEGSLRESEKATDPYASTLELEKAVDPYAAPAEPEKPADPYSTVAEPEKATDPYAAVPESE